MPYTPPDSKLVTLSFTAAYTPPDARLVWIDLIPPPTGSTQSIYPETISNYAVGAPTVENKAATIAPTGSNHGAFGGATVINRAVAITPDGNDHAECGVPAKVWNFHTFARASGRDVSVFGLTTVRNQHEHLRITGLAATQFGTTRAELEDRRRHALRYLNAFNKGVPEESGGPRAVFHSDSYVFVATSFVPVGPMTDFLTRYDRQTWQTDNIQRIISDPVSGDIIKPYPEVGYASVVGGMLMPCHARRADNSMYVGLLQLTSDGTYVAHSNLGQGDIYFFSAVGNRVYFTHGQTGMLYGGTGVNAAPLVSVQVLDTQIAANSTALFLMDVVTNELKRLDLDTGLPVATVSVTPSAHVLAVTDHVVWVVDGTATAYAYDLSLAPLNEVSVAAFEPSDSTPACSVPVQYPKCSANLAAIDTSHGTVLLYGSADRHTIAGYLPIAQGGIVPSTQLWPPPYAMPEQYMAFPDTPWPPDITRPSAINTPNLALHQTLSGTKLMSDTEAYLFMTLVQRIQPGGAGYIPPGWWPIDELVIKASVNVSSIITYAISPGGISPPTFGTPPSVRMQWQFVTPASTGHTSLGEPNTQLKNRAVLPQGIDPGLLGDVALRSNLLKPAGFDAADVPLPDVTDKHQNLYPASVTDSAIMGDLPHVWNFTTRVTPESVDHSYFANFQPLVENRTREARPLGYSAGRWGTTQIINKAVALGVEGFDATIYGDTNLTNWQQYRVVSGTQMALFGTAILINVQLVARPAGRDMLFVGGVYAGLRQQHIFIDGAAPPIQDTEPWISLSPREFGRYGGISSSAFSAPDVSHGVRHVLPTAFLPAVFGQTRADLARRTVEPQGVFFPTPAAAFGSPRLSPFAQTVVLQGQDYAVAAVPAIARNERAVDQVTLGDQAGTGTPAVELHRRYIQMFSTGTARYGEPDVWNWRTYVETWSPVMPDVLGTPAVELRNKTLRLAGYDMARVSAYADISNNARLMMPEGSSATLFGTTMVAPRIRTAVPSGDDLSAFGFWFTIGNTRQIIDTSGIPRPYAGVPRVWRNEQPLDAIGGDRSDTFGDTMVAPRIRTVTQYRYADPVAGFPTVDLRVQYVSPQGFAERFGWVAVEHFRNEARIFGINYARYGEPRIQNFNPQAWVYGIDMPPLPTAPWVSFRIRVIDLAAQAIGEYQPTRPAVEFRTRMVYPRGYALDAIPRTHDIRWDIPQVAPQQRISPVGIGVESFPRPFVGASIIFPESTDQARIGRPELTANSIWPQSSLSVFSFVEAPMISLRDRTIYIKTTRDNPSEPSRVQMSPAVIGPFGDIRADWLIDAHLAERDHAFDRPFFGNAVVTNFNRAITPLSTKHVAWGLPALATNKMAPNGWDSNEGKFGMTDFTGPIYIMPYWGRTTDDYIPEVPAYNFDTAVYGEPDVAYPVAPPVWSPYLNPVGLNAGGFGRVSVESTIRNIYPVGIAYDGKGEGWIPKVWLHPPFRLYPEGVIPPDITIAQIAYRIRTLQIQGDDAAIVCEEDVATISMRFRVRYGASRYVLGGIAPSAPTILQITHRNRALLPVTIPPTSYPAAQVQAQNRTTSAGWDSSVVGLPRRAVFGEVYPYAPDMHQQGYPKINRRATTQSIGAEGIAPVRIARPIRPHGSDVAGYEPPAITNIYGCRNRVITVGGNTDFSTFGGIHATH